MPDKPTKLYYLGLCLILISSGVFLFRLYGPDPGNNFLDGNLFWVNYGLTLLYFILIQGYNFSINRFRMTAMDDRLYTASLVLFSVSGHSLNLDLPVLAPYVNWLTGYVLLMHLALLAFPHRESFPRWMQWALYGVCGACFTLSSYLFLISLPVFAFGILAVLFFGISAHGTLPFWYLVTFLSFLAKKKSFPNSQRTFWIGALIPLLILGIYLMRWNSMHQLVTHSQEIAQSEFHGQLPDWVLLAQRLPVGPFTEEVVRSASAIQEIELDLFDSFSGNVKHDPLALIAMGVYGRLDIDQPKADKIIESLYQGRHDTHRRLWSGDDLKTTQVLTDLTIYPEFRLAYNEKTFHVKNTMSSRGWPRMQEAVYTFYLPEGAFVTSLSLWIEGEEQPSRLTTRSQADNAYSTIVGRERRDPALLHWQEGNRVTVTVFPCTREEERVFKVGFTQPLAFRGDRLYLDNISFDGPPHSSAKESLKLSFTGIPPLGLDLPFRFDHEEEEGTWHYKGPYLPERNISFLAPALSQESFSFKGKSVSLKQLSRQSEVFTPKEIILDLNGAWSWFELEQCWDRIRDYPVYVYLPEKVQLSSENYQEVFQVMQSWHFSLLPLHEIEAPAHSLIVTRSLNRGPNLSALDESPFALAMSQYLLAEDSRLKVYNLEHDLSPMLTTLRSLHRLDYVEGDMEGLSRILQEQKFPVSPESDSSLNLYSAGLQLQLSDAEGIDSSSSAPDLLFRLYAYNDLLRKIGRQYFDRSALETTWIRQAEEAFVVSPISSLVVLESQEDYERFGIEENQETLGNSVAPSKGPSFGNLIGGSGSTPEPHEWVLMILVGMIMLWKLLPWRR